MPIDKKLGTQIDQYYKTLAEFSTADSRSLICVRF
jgi:hypothetical protein